MRLMLDFLHGDAFKEKLNEYARPLIIKGVPPMLLDLHKLYSDQNKVKIIEDMITSMIAQMRINLTLSADEKEEEQDPTVFLWLLYYAAQHYLFVKDYEKALEFINEAIEHTPTVVELYMVKAQIYKNAGDIKNASVLYEEARKLDLADRFLNARSSRYLIRIDELKQAEETMLLFSKEGQELNVHDMQCMWYESEVGLSYLRQKNYQLALKNFNYIEKHFDQIYEDQFDFHLYSIRKFTVGAYFEMIEMEDSVYKSKYAVKCAIGIINTLKKINANLEEEKSKFEPLHKEYLESAEYKKL